MKKVELIEMRVIKLIVAMMIIIVLSLSQFSVKVSANSLVEVEDNITDTQTRTVQGLRDGSQEPIYADDEESLRYCIDSITSSGTIILEDNIDLISGTGIIIPNGLQITITSGENGPYTIYHTARDRHFRVEGELILRDVTLHGQSIGGGITVLGGALELREGAVVTYCYREFSGGGINLENNASLIIDGGEISYSRTTSGGVSGGGLHISNSTVIMNSGFIKYNESTWGGGVEVGTGSTFTLTNGTIQKNKATSESGGGVHVYIQGRFIMNGGIIRNNETPNTSMGGGVFVGQASHVVGEPTDWCSFIMNDGVIEGNTAQRGGGVASQWVGTIEINGGKITGNYALAGGGIYVTNSVRTDRGVSLFVNGGEISYNKATTNYGGGIWAHDNNTVDTGNPIYTVGVSIGSADNTENPPRIHHNEAASQGGGIMLFNSHNKLEAQIINTQIDNNEAGSLGGGICLYGGGKLSIANTNIQFNTSKTSGGGFGSYRSTYKGMFDLSIDSSRIENNVAQNMGGGIYLDQTAVAVLANTLIDENEAKNGGGAYVHELASLSAVNSTRFEGNIAANSGGGIYTADYDYNDPANTGAYTNISTDNTTVFTENISVQAHIPPKNTANFSNISFLESSILDGVYWRHLLNNYDINYEGEAQSLYRVTYDANGGTGSYADDGLTPGASYIVLSDTDTDISHQDFAFNGWNTSMNGNGTNYHPGNTLIISGNITLYAQWKANETSSGDNGSSGGSSSEITNPGTGSIGIKVVPVYLLLASLLFTIPTVIRRVKSL